MAIHANFDSSERFSSLGGNWIQNAFRVANRVDSDGISDGAVDPDVLFARFMGSAMFKYTTTELGANLCINPVPQPSRWTDPPPYVPDENLHEYRQSGRQGGFYAEMFDDSQQVIYLRFGVPVFSSLTGFLTRFYSPSLSNLVRRGGVPNSLAHSIGYGLTNFLGTAFRIPADVVSVIGGVVSGFASFPDNVINFVTGRKTSSFYYLKPTMAMYWGVVQNILNHLLVNSRFLEYYAGGENRESNLSALPLANRRYEKDNEVIEALKEQYPGVISDDGTFNVYGLATRGARAAHRVRNWLLEQAESGESLHQTMLRLYKQGIHRQFVLSEERYRYDNRSHNRSMLNIEDRNRSVEELEKFWKDMDKSASDVSDDPRISSKVGFLQSMLVGEDSSAFGDTGGSSFSAKNNSKESGFFELLNVMLNDGSDFIGIRVNHTGSVQESFRNSFRSSDLSEWFNTAQAGIRNAKFNVANGNLSDDTLSNFVSGALQGITDTISYAAEAVGLGGLGAVVGNAMMTIPKFWDKADADFPSKSYTIDLKSVNGDLFSRVVSLFIPFSMILPSVLPRSVGRHTYTEPFYCEIYDKGRTQSRLAMVRSLSITRGGGGNVSWTDDHEFLDMKITLEIEDMHDAMHMPVIEMLSRAGEGMKAALLGTISAATGETGKAIAANIMNTGFLDEDNSFTEYMAIISSCDLRSQIYWFDRIRKKMRLNTIAYNSRLSKEYLTMRLSETTMGGIAKAFYVGVQR